MACGFSTLASLSGIDEQAFTTIEEFMRNHREIIDGFNCCNAEQYICQPQFQLLPGHKAILLYIPKQIETFKQNNVNKKDKKSKKNPLSDDDLKERLITNVNNYVSKLNVPGNIFSCDRHIHNFERNQDGYGAKCEFSCCFCKKTVPVVFDEFWKSSNITTHLKNHINHGESYEDN